MFNIIGGIVDAIKGEPIGEVLKSTFIPGYTGGRTVYNSAKDLFTGSSDTLLGKAVNYFNGSSGSSSGLSSYDLSQREMNYNSAEAQKNRDWQEHMRDTALTSAFNQARENGINPYAMFSGGSVSSPGGSAASYSGYASSSRSAEVSSNSTLLRALTALAIASM